MPFAFSLAAVLTVRRNHEEAQERQLALLAAAIQTTTQDLHRLEIELQRLAAERASRPPQLLQAIDIHEDYARCALFQQGRTTLAAYLAELQTQKEAQRQAYLLARRDRETLEQLEADQQATYAASLVRQETKRNEDAFLARHRLR